MSDARHSPPPSAAAPRPKGILKNAAERTPSAQNTPVLEEESATPEDQSSHLQWDESNLTLHEIERENQAARMKIDEPKTPFVRGTSLGPFGDDEGFDLDGQSFFPPGASASGSGSAPTTPSSSSRRPSSASAAEQLAANTSANAGRRPSASNAPAPAVGLDEADINGAGTEGGVASPTRSTRSPSFSLPDRRRSGSRGGEEDGREGLRQEQRERRDEPNASQGADVDGMVEEEDEDPETKAKHAEFAAKRNRHYGNEAEAMKIAAALAAQEPDEDEDNDEEMTEPPAVPPLPNGRGLSMSGLGSAGGEEGSHQTRDKQKSPENEESAKSVKIPEAEKSAESEKSAPENPSGQTKSASRAEAKAAKAKAKANRAAKAQGGKDKSDAEPQSTQDGTSNKDAEEDRAVASAPQGSSSGGRGGGRGGKNAGRNPRDPRSQPPNVQLSKALSYILRHGALKEGLKIREDGFVKLEDVLRRPRVKKIEMPTAESQGIEVVEGGPGGKRSPALVDVQMEVESNEKKRFELRDENGEWWIRAVQGHSIAVTELDHTPITLENLSSIVAQPASEDGDTATEGTQAEPIITVVHGTNSTAWKAIQETGRLSRMTRNHIHLATGRPGDKGVISGMRSSSSVLIFIDIARAIKDGIPFVRSSNGVVLTPGKEGSGLLPMEYVVRVEDRKGDVIWTQTI